MSLTQAEKHFFLLSFDYIDADHGGTITLSELLQSSADLGFELSLDELRSIVELVDDSGDGEIDKGEFLQVMTLMLYRHKLVSSSDDDDDDDAAASSGGKGGGAGAGGDVSAFLGPDGTLSAAATPDEKARAQQVMKHRAGWAADAVQQLHTSLASIDAAVDGIKAAREGTGIGGESGPGAADGGSANLQAFQMRKAQEQAQAQHRLAKAATTRLVKRILIEARSRGITTAQLPQIESLELDEENEQTGGGGGGAQSSSSAAAADNQQSNSNGEEAADQEEEEDQNTVDPKALLQSLRALAARLKSAAEALGANLVPVSMVKGHHTRGGGRALGRHHHHHQQQQQQQQRGGSKQSRADRVALVRKKMEEQQILLPPSSGEEEDDESPAADATKKKQSAAGPDGKKLTMTAARKPHQSKPKINQEALKSQLSALENYDLEIGGAEEKGSGSSSKKPPVTGQRPATPTSSANRADGGKKIDERVLSLVSGDSTLPGSQTAQQLAASAPRAADQLRAVAQQVLRSWAFPITPVCEQLDLMEERWAEYSSLLQGQEALTRPACALGRACPDRYNHAHRLQLTHPCYCRVDRFAIGSPESKETLERQAQDPLMPLSEAALCPHMVRPVHGTCYTHLPPIEEVQPPPASPPTSPYASPTKSAAAAAGGGASPSSSSLNESQLQLSLSAARASKDPAQQRALRFNELRGIVGRVDLSNMELGGIGAQAIAFVIAQDVALQDSALQTGQASQLYAVSSDEYSSSSNHYRFKDIVLNKCCIPTPGAIALLRIAHNLRLLDMSNNSMGVKTVIIAKEDGADESKKSSGGEKKHAATAATAVETTPVDVPPAPELSSPNPAAKKAPSGKPPAGGKRSAAAAAAAAGKKGGATEDKKEDVYSSATAAAAADDNSGAAEDKKDDPASAAAAAALLAQQQQAQSEAEAAASTPSLMGIHVREMLLRNGNLTHLNLSGNKLTDSDGIGIAEGLRNNVTLRVIDLSNNELGVKFGRDFAFTLQENVDLRCLRLAYNPLEAAGTQSICEVVKESAVVEELDLTWTGLGPQGAAHLADTVSNCGALARLCIAHNAIGLNGAISLGRALPNSQSIVHLDIGHNVVNEVGVIELLNGLRGNSSLAVLDITNTAQNVQSVMKEIAQVTADRMQKFPAAPLANVVFAEQLAQSVPAKFQQPDEPLKLQKVPKAPAQGTKRGKSAAGRGGSGKTSGRK